MAVGVKEARPWAAGRAGDGLGVKAARAGPLVLAPAFGTEREAGHRRVRTVAGHLFQDGETRPAVGAGGERVAVTAVGPVADLGQAGPADGTVGRDPGLVGPGSGAG